MAIRKDELIAEMQRNSNAWHSADAPTRERLRRRNTELAAAIDTITGGKSVYDGSSGTWQLSDGTRSLSIGGRVEYITPGDYSGSRENEINAALTGLGNYPEFKYDAESDPLWSQYRKQYIREGERAAKDTLGEVSARTGGMASSYAATAAQQAQNYYNAALSDKLPELAELAYEMYSDAYDREYKRLSALMEADDAEYSRWESARDHNYVLSRDAVSDRRYEEERAYERERDAAEDARRDEETAYERERDAAADARRDEETAYERERDAAADARRDEETAYERERDAAADVRYEEETAYERERDAIADARYEEERDYERERDAEEAAPAPTNREITLNQLARRMLNSADPHKWLENHADSLSDHNYAKLWEMLEG